MRRSLALVLALAVAGCGMSPSSSSPGAELQPLAFEPFSPPQFTSHDVFLAARGDVVVLAGRYSVDAGATWRPLDPRLGSGIDRVAVEGPIVSLYAGNGLARWNTATGDIVPVAGVPTFTSARTWRLAPGGTFVTFDALRNAIAIEGPAGWQTASLPPPTATEVDPYITDVESNGTVMMAVSAWGIYRSPDHGTTWTRIAPYQASAGRELVVLADRRFVLLGGTSTFRFDATGQPAGESTGLLVESGDASACDDGTILVRDLASRDAGATWQPVLGGGDLQLTVERVGCGGNRYWIVGHSDAWGYRLLRYDGVALASGVAVGNWELTADVTWGTTGTSIVRTADGTFVVAGLAWREGDAAWSLREAPARVWAAGDTLFGVAGDRFFTSDDAGRTWRATAMDVFDGAEPEAFARAPDGALHVGAFSGETIGSTDRWQARVWRTTGDTASWSLVHDSVATREGGGEVVGEAHRFVGITSDGAWVATDAVSADAGATWQSIDVNGDRSLGFLTPGGHLVTPRDDVWRVYDAVGDGELRASWRLEVDGEPVPASSLRAALFDEAGHAYVARGAPYVQLWRTTRTLLER